MPGIFDTGIFDTGIFDHEAVAPPVTAPERFGGADRWWRSRRKRPDDELEALKEAYVDLQGAGAEVVAPVAAVVAPFVEVDFETLPPVISVDWYALARTAYLARLKDALVEAQRLQDEEDENILLLMAA